MRWDGAAVRRWRGLRPGVVAVAGLLALVAAVGLPQAGMADEPEIRGIDRVCPVPDKDEISFDDAGATHGAAISCAATYRLVSGFDDGTFRPSEDITREQMASFVTAWVERATGVGLPLPDERRFDDVGDGVHADAVEKLAEAGIVDGRGDETFEPQATLTRGQFAAVVANAISYADVLDVDGPLPPDGDPQRFDDVPDTTFEQEIASLAQVGVTGGVTSDRFAPREPVTRGQLATFLMRSADYLDAYQRWRPTAEGSVVLLAELEAVVQEDDDDAGDGDASDDDAADGGTDGDGAGDDAADGGSDGDGSDGHGADGGGADGDGGDDGQRIDGDDEPPSGSATLTVNAFNSTLAFSLDLSQVPGPYAEQGATIHLGDPEEGGGELVLQLADGEELAESTGGVVTGVVFESASSMRFSDLTAAPQDAYVQVATEDAPDGAVRGQLRGTEG